MPRLMKMAASLTEHDFIAALRRNIRIDGYMAIERSR